MKVRQTSIDSMHDVLARATMSWTIVPEPTALDRYVTKRGLLHVLARRRRDDALERLTNVEFFGEMLESNEGFVVPLRHLRVVGLSTCKVGYLAACGALPRANSIEHAAFVTRAARIGSFLAAAGLLNAAAAFAEWVLAAREATLGTDHEDTLDALATVASTARAKGDFDIAEVLLRRALDASESTHGSDSRSTLKLVTALGSLLSREGAVEEAEHLLKRAVEGMEVILGPHHSETLDAANSLAGLLHRRGNLRAAQTLVRRVLSCREASLGRNALETVRAVSNLGLVLKTRGKFRQALPFVHYALRWRESNLGYNHPETLASKHIHSNLLRSLGRLVEAEAEFRDTIRARESTLGPCHPDTIASLSCLAYLLADDAERASEAAGLLRSTLSSLVTSCGPLHALTLRVERALCFVLLDQGRREEAVSHWRPKDDDSQHESGALCHAARGSRLPLVNEVFALIEAGRYGEAEWVLERSSPEADSQCSNDDIVLRERQWAALELGRGARERAENRLQRALSVATDEEVRRTIASELAVIASERRSGAAPVVKRPAVRVNLRDSVENGANPRSLVRWLVLTVVVAIGLVAAGFGLKQRMFRRSVRDVVPHLVNRTELPPSCLRKHRGVETAQGRLAAARKRLS